MKRIGWFVAVALLAPWSCGGAGAEPVDMSTITCGQLMGMKQDEISFILTWVTGYVAGTEAELSLDPDDLNKTVTETVQYCTGNQEMSVLNAIKEVSEE